MNVFSLSHNTSLSIVFAITFAFLWIFLKANTILKIAYVLLFSYPLYGVIKIYLLKTPTPQNISLLLNLTALNWIIFGVSLFSLIYLAITYRSFTRQVRSLKSKIREIAVLIKSTFEVSIPIFTILKYKLAICKDYAKLTYILLYNLFPDAKIYFISIPWHIAVGIEVNRKLYVLDQKLPVLTLDNWLKVWNRRTTTIYQLKVLDLNKKRLKLEKQRRANLANPSTSIDIARLREEVVKLMKINKTSQKESKVFRIPIPNLAKCYEDDEVVIYSMARAIKLKLENELCSNINEITRVNLFQEGNNLIVRAYL